MRTEGATQNNDEPERSERARSAHLGASPTRQGGCGWSFWECPPCVGVVTSTVRFCGFRFDSLTG